MQAWIRCAYLNQQHQCSNSPSCSCSCSCSLSSSFIFLLVIVLGLVLVLYLVLVLVLVLVLFRLFLFIFLLYIGLRSSIESWPACKADWCRRWWMCVGSHSFRYVGVIVIIVIILCIDISHTFVLQALLRQLSKQHRSRWKRLAMKYGRHLWAGQVHTLCE